MNYVGYLTDVIQLLSYMVAFYVFIHERLNIHGVINIWL